MVDELPLFQLVKRASPAHRPLSLHRPQSQVWKQHLRAASQPEEGEGEEGGGRGRANQALCSVTVSGLASKEWMLLQMAGSSHRKGTQKPL